jgi:hypothetical protein
MKNQMFALIGLGLLLATVSANAQTDVAKANVPFDFVVTGKTLPAGEYTIQSVDMQEMVLSVWLFRRCRSSIPMSWRSGFRGHADHWFRAWRSDRSEATLGFCILHYADSSRQAF